MRQAYKRRKCARRAEVPEAVLHGIFRNCDVLVCDEIGWLMKRSSKMFGDRWQRRVVFIKNNPGEGYVLHYTDLTDLTEDSGASQSSLFNVFSKPSGHKTMSFGKSTTVSSFSIYCIVLQRCVKTYHQVSINPSDGMQFTITGARNDNERQLVLKAPNAGGLSQLCHSLLHLRCVHEGVSLTFGGSRASGLDRFTRLYRC